jgi:hypothetical protein
MSRHFVVTMNVHPMTGEQFTDPCDGEGIHEEIQESLDLLDRIFGKNLRYRIAQLEKGSKSDKPENQDIESEAESSKTTHNGFHLQCYVETSQSIRLRTVWRGVPYAYVRPRNGLRDTAREYCMPEKGSPFVGEYDPTHIAGPWEVGEWRQSDVDETSDSPLEVVGRRLIAGACWRDIAFDMPKTFIRNGRGIRELHDALAICDSCRSRLEFLKP